MHITIANSGCAAPLHIMDIQIKWTEHICACDLFINNKMKTSVGPFSEVKIIVNFGNENNCENNCEL